VIQPIPISRYLVPERSVAVPDGFTRVDSQLRAGVPHALTLTATERLLLIVPSGVAAFWRDADPGLLIGAAEPELVPLPAPASLPPASLARLPMRLLFQVNNRTVAVAPLVAGTVQLLPEGDGATARIELAVLDWRVHAGTLRGAGDFGSHVSVAWRSADQAVSEFSDPPLNPVFVKRQPPEKRVISDVGHPMHKYLRKLEDRRDKMKAKIVR
jgi:hypothetical protein